MMDKFFNKYFIYFKYLKSKKKQGVKTKFI